MEIMRFDVDTYGNSITISDYGPFPLVLDGDRTATDSLYLDVGRYLVVFTLYPAQGQSVEVSAILHIYWNMVSRFIGADVFPDFSFPRSLLDIILGAWGNPENYVWNFAHPNHGITAGHFGLHPLYIRGINTMNFGDIVGRFNTLSYPNRNPDCLDGLRALVDAALIGINMDAIVDIITGGVYADRVAKETAIRALPWFVALNDPDDVVFYPEDASATITAVLVGDYTVTINLADDVTWTAIARGTPYTTAIDFVFGAPVSGLTENDIAVTAGSGAVMYGGLVGVGTLWTLEIIDVTTSGDISIAINRDGIVSGPRTVAVTRPAPPVIPITWEAEAYDDPYTTAIVFEFGEAVSDLTASHIMILPGTGSVIRRALTGSGDTWRLEVDVVTPGNITVSIIRPGLASGSQTVPVTRAPITWTAIARGTPYTIDIDLVFDAPVVGLTGDGITVEGELGGIPTGDLTGSGTLWTLPVTITSSGDITVSISVPGLASGPQTVAVTGPAPPVIPITWNANPYGAPYTTAIVFGFGEAVPDLTASHIMILPGTGSVIRRGITSEGQSWRLAVDVVTSGTITVSVIRPGIASESQTVTVTRAPITWNAFARGTLSTTAIDFVFDAPISELTQNNITIAGGPGAVITGDLTGGGTLWTLPVTSVTTPGDITVSIERQGIAIGTQPLTVIRQITWEVHDADVINDPITDTTTAIYFTFNAAVEDLTATEVKLQFGTGRATVDDTDPPEVVPNSNGTRWRVAIVTERAGTVAVDINRPGVESRLKFITVSRPHIGWGATAVGTPTSAIDLSFNAPVAGLEPHHVVIMPGNTSVIWGSLELGVGNAWSIGVDTVTIAGDVSIWIDRAGIDPVVQTVTIVAAEPFPPLAPVRTRVGAGRSHTIAIGSLDRLMAWGSKPSISWNIPTPNILSPGSTDNLVSISAGDSHTMAVRANGYLYAWGDNAHGQLGPGGNQPSLIRVVWSAGELAAAGLESNTGWVSVFAGGNHTVAIREDGSLWAWGSNTLGQLGDGTYVSRNTPRRVQPLGAPSDMRWALASLYGNHTLAIGEDGTLWAWGDNWHHQLGSGTTANVLTPTPIMSGTYWRHVSTGYQHTFAIRKDGSLLGWGRNWVGEIGQGATGVLAYHPTPIEIGDVTIDWAHVAAGHQYTVAIRTDGSLWAWGNNVDGQLGDGTNTNRTSPVRIGADSDWVFVFAGENHTVAVRENGSVWTWGSNVDYQLGRTTLPSNAPGQATTIPFP